MVMIFANQKVREYLLEHGLVYTYRKNHKKTADGIRSQTGRDWATDRRKGKKIADIYITVMESISSIHPLTNRAKVSAILAKYIEDSGFYQGSLVEAISEWESAIYSLNPNAPMAGWIYRVNLIGADSQ